MDFYFRRSYRGPLKAAILDWAGTTLDYGCMAPVAAFVEAFKAKGVTISVDEARGPMGAHKKTHIAQVAALPSVAAQWQTLYGRKPNDADVSELFEIYMPLQMGVLDKHTTMIPGVNDAVAALRAQGLKIGSTTGYLKPMMDVVQAAAKKQGYEPDAAVCASDVPAGRPEPWMCFENARQLRVYPCEAMVKIGDTVVDVHEGLNAGMWTIGLAKTGNEMGLSERDLAALSKEDYEVRLRQARERLCAAGAHYVVDSVCDVPAIVEHINKRLQSEGRAW